MRRAMRGADAVIHGAATYEIALTAPRRRAMFDANVRGTERVLSLAGDAGVGRMVYVSTIAVFGDTHGRVVDESYRRSGPAYASYYEETTFPRARDRRPAHRARLTDHHRAARSGLRSLTFVGDVAAGIVLALDRGQAGRSCVLGGEIARVAQAFGTLGRVVGRRPPRFRVPYAPLEAAALIVPRLREIVTSAKGVTFWATDARARAELGDAPRDLETGFRETYRSSSSSSSSSSDSNSSE